MNDALLADFLIGELADVQAKRRIVMAFERGRLTQDEATALIADCDLGDVEL